MFTYHPAQWERVGLHCAGALSERGREREGEVVARVPGGARVVRDDNVFQVDIAGIGDGDRRFAHQSRLAGGEAAGLGDADVGLDNDGGNGLGRFRGRLDRAVDDPVGVYLRLDNGDPSLDHEITCEDDVVLV